MKTDLDPSSVQSPSAKTEFAPHFAGADCYRENAFRIAELGVEATEREFKRRINEVEQTGSIGVPPPQGPGAILPLSPPADVIRLREVHQRITGDPEQRMAEEFFWFWPQTPGGARTDEALLALRRGDFAVARRIWSERELQPAEQAVAAHNVAVLDHHLIIEATTSGEAGPLPTWPDNFKQWRRVHESEATWRWQHARTQVAGDPRRTTGMVRRLQQWLPRSLLAINVQLVEQLLAQNRQSDARAQLVFVVESGFEFDAIEAVRTGAAAVARSRVRALCASAKTECAAHPARGRSVGESLLEQAAIPLGLIELLLPESDPTRNGAHDEVAEQVRSGLVGYGSRTEDWSGSLPLLERAQGIAATTQTRERVEKDLKVVRNNAEETNWWHGPGYFDLPAPIVAELERGYALSETGDNEAALRVVISVWQGKQGVEIPTELHSVVARVVAYALNAKSVRANNRAIDIYNENQAIILEFRKRAPSQFGNSSFQSSIAAATAGRAAQCRDLICMICGCKIAGPFTVFSGWGEFCTLTGNGVRLALL